MVFIFTKKKQNRVFTSVLGLTTFRYVYLQNHACLQLFTINFTNYGFFHFQGSAVEEVHRHRHNSRTFLRLFFLLDRLRVLCGLTCATDLFTFSHIICAKKCTH